MALPNLLNDQINDAISQAHRAGGDEALAVIAELITHIAKGLQQDGGGTAALEAFSVAFETAEMAFHDIIAERGNDSAPT